MTDRHPPATAPLTGTPRRGTLALPAPRPPYSVEITRTSETTARLTVSRPGAAQTTAALYWFGAHLDDDLRSVAARWQSNVWIDGYEFSATADPEMRVLTVLDDLAVQRVACRSSPNTGAIQP